MAERLIAAVLKTACPKGHVGSNPTSSSLWADSFMKNKINPAWIKAPYISEIINLTPEGWEKRIETTPPLPLDSEDRKWFRWDGTKYVEVE